MNTTTLSDEELLALGDQHFEVAVNELYNRYKTKGSKFFYRMLLDSGMPKVTYEDCEDSFNEYFYRAIMLYDAEKGKFSTFLKKVIRYSALNYIRDHHINKDPLAFSTSMEREIFDGFTMHDIVSSTDGFHCNLDVTMNSPKGRFIVKNKDTRNVILALKGLGFTIEEISKQTKVSKSSIQRILSSAKKVEVKLTGDIHMD